MTSRRTNFLYENHFYVIMAVIDIDMLQNDKELN